MKIVHEMNKFEKYGNDNINLFEAFNNISVFFTSLCLKDTNINAIMDLKPSYNDILRFFHLALNFWILYGFPLLEQ